MTANSDTAPYMADAPAPSRDTIFALASGQAKAGVSVFRLSGPQALSVTVQLCGALPAPRRASLRRIRRPSDGAVLDEALVLTFPAPRSFTGEHCAEFQIHGSPAIAQALAETLFGLGLRMAEPGEFTRRAFENGRMDLTEAEGLADLIDAQTERQRVQALRQMQGGLRQTYEGWQGQLYDALAMIEGEIDFADEGDVPSDLAIRAMPLIQPLQQALRESLDKAGRGEVTRHGLEIAIIGPPNAGKSTLINGLSQKEAAIVSPIAGTTRDVVETHIDIAGLPVRLADTAGLRATDDQIESEGIRRAHARADQADLRIGVIDLTRHGSDLAELLPLLQSGDLLVLNKSDLQPDRPQNVSRETFDHLMLSLLDGAGVGEVRSWVEDQISQRFALTEQAGLTRARHRDCVQRALAALERAEENIAEVPELAGEDLRQALKALQELAGQADIERVLDRIFSRFCIGK